MAEQAQERTEPATAHRRREAWKAGDVAYSRRVSPLLRHLAFTLFFGVLAQSAALALMDFTRRMLSLPPSENMQAVIADAVGVFVRVSWPFWALGMGCTLLAGFAQTGLVPNFLRLQPRFDRLSPAHGLQRLSRLPLADALIALPLALFLALGSLLLLWMMRTDVLALQAPVLTPRFMDLFQKLLWIQFAVIFVLSAMDAGFVLWRHSRRLRMTRREIQEEHRQQEGDPHMRAQRRGFFERLLAMPPEHRLIAQAKVVIVNPEHLAVAVGTDETREPCVLARGRGETARCFRRLAQRSGIPVIQDPQLARALYALEEEEPIPAELLEALAVIFVALKLD